MKVHGMKNYDPPVAVLQALRGRVQAAPDLAVLLTHFFNVSIRAHQALGQADCYDGQVRGGIR